MFHYFILDICYEAYKTALPHFLPTKVNEFLYQTNFFDLPRLTKFNYTPFGKRW